MGLKKSIRNIYLNFLKKKIKKGENVLNFKEKGLLKIGICLANRISSVASNLQVYGEELGARDLGKHFIRHCPQIGAWQLYDLGEAKRIDADIIFVRWPDYPSLVKDNRLKIFWIDNTISRKKVDILLKDYNYVFSASRRLSEKYPEMIYLPEACVDINLFKKMKPQPEWVSEVCFIGNYFEYGRPTWHQEKFLLPAAKYDFHLWGSNWENCKTELKNISKGRLDPLATQLVYASSKIVLSNHQRYHQKMEMLNARIFEALACESLVISDRFDEVENIFGNSVVFTEGGKDLEEKIAYYLNHPKEREKKVRGARDKIVKFHTFKNRVNEIAKTVGLEFSNSLINRDITSF